MSVPTIDPPEGVFFQWPTAELVGLVSPWGPRQKKDGTPGFHNGWDLATPYGSRLMAPERARVVQVGRGKANGLFCILEHPGQVRTGWAHLSAVLVAAGDFLYSANVFAISGNSGHVRPAPTPERPRAGSHVHLTVTTLRMTRQRKRTRRSIDPATCFDPVLVEAARDLWVNRKRT